MTRRVRQPAVPIGRMAPSRPDRGPPLHPISYQGSGRRPQAHSHYRNHGKIASGDARAVKNVLLNVEACPDSKYTPRKRSDQGTLPGSSLSYPQSLQLIYSNALGLPDSSRA